MKDEKPFNWSKDFVEHLRTVHFALAAVSLALIIAISAQDRRLPVALIQIEQIAKLEKQWSGVQGLVYKTVHQGLPDSWTATVTLDLPANVYHSKSLEVLLLIPSAQLAASTVWIFPSGRSWPSDMTTLAEFRTFWNDLRRGIDLWEIIEPSHLATCSQNLAIVYPDGSKRYLYSFVDFVTSAVKPQVTCHYGISNVFTASAMPRFKTRSFITDFSATESLLRLEVEIPQNVSPLIKSAPRGTTLLSISDIRAQKQRFHVNQSTLKTLFFDDWKQGLDFAQAFPELNTESAGLGTLDITDTKARIESEAAGAANSISLVGLTIPLIQLTRWAPLVLLSTQLYFWLHLYELVRKIKPDADGWEVAWIGIYRTLPAFIVALFSACVLPAVAAVCLGVTFVTSHYYGRGVAVAGCSLIIVAGFLLSALTAARLFRLRANG